MNARARWRPVALAWAALMALLLLTLGLAYLPLGRLNLVAALAIAAAKAALVVVVFMHPRRGPSALRVAAVVGVATLSLLFGLSSLDFGTRHAEPAAAQVPKQLPPLRQPGSGPGPER